jgi:hypothetical protein
MKCLRDKKMQRFLIVLEKNHVQTCNFSPPFQTDVLSKVVVSALVFNTKNRGSNPMRTNKFFRAPNMLQSLSPPVQNKS